MYTKVAGRIHVTASNNNILRTFVKCMKTDESQKVFTNLEIYNRKKHLR